MEKYTEVLVIDNDEGFTTECVEFLQNSCNVGADMALTAEEAENKLKNFPIKIILLDYDMPVNGLELFPRLKKIDPCVEIVFISAVATNDVLYKSEKFPFATRMAKANCSKELPQLIPSLLMKYENNNIRKAEVFYTERKGLPFQKYKIEYSICSYEIVDKDYIFPDSWHTSQMIQAGEKLKHEEEMDYEKIFSFTENFKMTTDFDFGMESGSDSYANLKLALSTELEKDIKSDYSEKIKVAINRIRELSLSDNNGDNSIVARYYDFANVYLKMKLRIKKYCTCCASNSIFLATVYFPVPKVAYRIREYYNGKEPQIIDSGFYETGFSAARLM